MFLLVKATWQFWCYRKFFWTYSIQDSTNTFWITLVDLCLPPAFVYSLTSLQKLGLLRCLGLCQIRLLQCEFKFKNCDSELSKGFEYRFVDMSVHGIQIWRVKWPLLPNHLRTVGVHSCSVPWAPSRWICHAAWQWHQQSVAVFCNCWQWQRQLRNNFNYCVQNTSTKIMSHRRHCYAPAQGALSDDAVWRLTSVAYIRSAGGVCGRPAGWRVLADRARLGRPGSRLPLRTSVAGLGGGISWRPSAYSLLK